MPIKFYSGSHEPASSPVGTVSSVADQVKGTRFEDVLNANPYQDLPRQQTGWDRFVNWLGFRSGYDKAQEQYNLASSEYQAQVAQLASEEQYNSPSAQAMRMRQAGLNPDLTGLSVEPASEFDNQQESPDVSGINELNPLDIISTIGRGFVSTITGTVGLLNDLNLLNQSRIATDQKDLEFGKQMIDFFEHSNSFMTGLSGNPFNVIVSNLNEHNPSIFHSSRMAKRFNKFRQSASDSLLGLTTQYKTYDDFLKHAESFGKSMSQPFFSGFGSLSAYDVAQFLKPLSKAQFDLNMAQIKADNAKAYKDYHQNAVTGDAYAKLDDPNSGFASSLAESIQSGVSAETAENRARSSIAPLEVTKNKIIGRMLNQIESIPDKNIGTTILKFFLVNQLSSGIHPLDNASSLAGIAKTISKF